MKKNLQKSTSFSNLVPLTSDGIVAFGIPPTPKNIILAYKNGIFPWPIDDIPLPWFSPPQRGILEKKYFHLPKSLKKALKKLDYQCTIDQNFKEVISVCATVQRKGQSSTWITSELKESMIQLHHLKLAHSVEVWSQGQLVGGLYGLSIDGCFSAESMFYRKAHASKFAIIFLMDYLFSQGLDWIDIQILSPHLEQLGAREISRYLFLLKLKKTKNKNFQLFSDPFFFKDKVN